METNTPRIRNEGNLIGHLVDKWGNVVADVLTWRGRWWKVPHATWTAEPLTLAERCRIVLPEEIL